MDKTNNQKLFFTYLSIKKSNLEAILKNTKKGIGIEKDIKAGMTKKILENIYLNLKRNKQ